MSKRSNKVIVIGFFEVFVKWSLLFMLKARASLFRLFIVDFLQTVDFSHSFP